MRLVNAGFSQQFGCVELVFSFGRDEIGERTVETLRRYYDRLDGVRLAEPSADTLADLGLRILTEGLPALENKHMWNARMACAA